MRAASAADAQGIARVHVGSWRTTYKGIVPDEHLANLSEEKRAAFWGKYVADLPARSHVFVALDAAGQIVGFTNGGVNREVNSEFDGEVMAIYLMKDHQGSGVGRRLLQESIDRLTADGFKGMMIWVLADNTACGFYERMGGKVVAEKRETIGGKPLKELAAVGLIYLLALSDNYTLFYNPD